MLHRRSFFPASRLPSDADRRRAPLRPLARDAFVVVEFEVADVDHDTPPPVTLRLRGGRERDFGPGSSSIPSPGRTECDCATIGLRMTIGRR